jgi:hypothetical protein
VGREKEKLGQGFDPPQGIPLAVKSTGCTSGTGPGTAINEIDIFLLDAHPFAMPVLGDSADRLVQLGSCINLSIYPGYITMISRDEIPKKNIRPTYPNMISMRTMRSNTRRRSNDPIGRGRIQSTDN